MATQMLIYPASFTSDRPEGYTTSRIKPAKIDKQPEITIDFLVHRCFWLMSQLDHVHVMLIFLK